MQTTILEPEALNLEHGRFGTSFNGQTYQVDAVTTLHGWQYATYVDARRRVCVARRRLPDGPWERIAFDDYTIDHTDVHNVPVLGICRLDGTIHLAFDHHGSPLHYRVSAAGVATEPESVAWTSALFGPIAAELVAGEPLSGVTYPCFFPAPMGALQLYYRIGKSGEGDSHLAEYDPGRGGWTAFGAFVGGAGDFAGSQSRNAYHNGFDYGPNGTLHTTWVWREGLDNRRLGLLNCHDLLYASSLDGGRTWQNNAGETIGKAGADPVQLDSAGLTVWPLPIHRGMMNQVTQTVDSAGRVHVVLWLHPPDVPATSTPPPDMRRWRYHHYWRDLDGQWRERQLPYVGRKPMVIAAANDDLVLVFTKPTDPEYHGTDPGGPLYVLTASAAAGWADWQVRHRVPEHYVGEPRVDTARWRREGLLSVYAQCAPERPGQPSQLRVLDVKL